MKAMFKEKEDILTGDMLKVLIAISIPIVFTNFLDGLYGVIDGLLVAYVGSYEVSTVTFVNPIIETLNAIGVGLSIAGGSLVGRYIGAQDEKLQSSLEQRRAKS